MLANHSAAGRHLGELVEFRGGNPDERHGRRRTAPELSSKSPAAEEIAALLSQTCLPFRDPGDTTRTRERANGMASLMEEHPHRQGIRPRAYESRVASVARRPTDHLCGVVRYPSHPLPKRRPAGPCKTLSRNYFVFIFNGLRQRKPTRHAGWHAARTVDQRADAQTFKPNPTHYFLENRK
jgi:hypothetical protein